MPMEQIFYKKILVGIKITTLKKGSVPVTDGKEPLQVVALKHKKGAYLKAHMHRSRQRVTSRLQECLVVKKGRIKVDLYGPDKKFFRKLFLNSGQILILMNGGIGIHIVKDAEIFEFKNGPFKEDKILI